MLVLPALDADIYAALRQSIEDFGVIVPVVYNRGELVDGANRTKIAGELGIDVPRIDLDIDPGHAEQLGVELNTARRQMSRDVRRSIVKSLIEAGYSQRVTAKAVGVAHTTVQRDLGATGTGVPVDVPDRSLGLDGKSRPTKRKKTDALGRARPQAQPGPIRNKKEEINANSLNRKFQGFLGSTIVATDYFAEADFILLAKVLTPDDVAKATRDLAAIAASCRSMSNRLKEASNA